MSIVVETMAPSMHIYAYSLVKVSIDSKTVGFTSIQKPPCTCNYAGFGIERVVVIYI